MASSCSSIIERLSRSFSWSTSHSQVKSCAPAIYPCEARDPLNRSRLRGRKWRLGNPLHRIADEQFYLAGCGMHLLPRVSLSYPTDAHSTPARRIGVKRGRQLLVPTRRHQSDLARTRGTGLFVTYAARKLSALGEIMKDTGSLAGKAVLQRLIKPTVQLPFMSQSEK